MTLLSWNWDDYGYFAELGIDEVCHTIRHQYGGGYDASRPEASKMQKEFQIQFTYMTSENWIFLVEFWRSVHGNADAFYFQFPAELYGSPGYGGFTFTFGSILLAGGSGYGGYGGVEPPDGFDADQAVGYGEGPIFTTKFVNDRLPQRHRSDIPGYWRTDQILIREVA